eukprot:TRINITY_DN52757_c0_g1_i2.p2 TRINITY_DN52757_c0_g1~~TRINITY_DN52757_c0_g1_i2.p2  ORF type:complete len:263 (-),score=86.28 TRINITY_DN52757_c0_g1_i2:1070-1858(-)
MEEFKFQGASSLGLVKLERSRSPAGGRGKADKKANAAGGKAAGSSGADTAPAAAVVPTEGGGAEGKGSGKGNKQMDLVVRLLLQLSRDMALVRSAILTTVLFDKDSSDILWSPIKTVTVNFFDSMQACKTQQEKDALLSPHIYAWLEFLEVLYKIEECKAVVVEHQKNLKVDAAMLMHEHKVKEVPAMKIAVGMCIKIFRFNSTFKQERLKLEISTVGHAIPVQHAIQNLMVSKYAGVVKFGSAPKSDLERRLEKTINRKHK